MFVNYAPFCNMFVAILCVAAASSSVRFGLKRRRRDSLNATKRVFPPGVGRGGGRPDRPREAALTIVA